VKLRGHHLLCVFGWQGHGYSESFNRRMDEVVRSLKEEESSIRLETKPDDICKSCPNLESDHCHRNGKDKEDNVEAHDIRVLDFFNLKPDTQISAKDLNEVVKAKKPHEYLRELCNDCQWLEKNYCYESLKKVGSSELGVGS